MSETTLYPKISGKPGEFVYRLKRLGLGPGEIELVGTIKLHGSHADIAVDNEDNIRLQSRNVLSLNADHDNYGYVKFMLPLRREILDLKSRYFARFAELNPGKTVNPNHPLIIAGEWIGEKVQKGVALTQLSKRFVIISASINNTWLPDEHYANIHNEPAGIYNISRGGFFYHTLVLDPPQDESKHRQEASFTAMLAQTEGIDKLCPFAASFGISGVGEGIVWKLRELSYNADPDLWFKTKGPTHREQPPKKERNAEDMSARVQAVNFAEQVVTERRLEQGFEYLSEMGLLPSKTNTGRYLQWVQNDVLTEERMEIEGAGIDEKKLKSEIGKIAKNHYAGYLVKGKG